MSYILDALKKSDQERQQSAGPSLQTVHRPHSNNGGRGWLYVLLVILVLLLLALAGLLAWLVFDIGNDDSEKITSPAATMAVREDTAKQLPAPETSTLSKDSNASSLSAAAKPHVAEDAPPTSTSTVVVPFSQLPLAARNAIPAMTFSFHVYSDNPDRRTIIINGRRVKQGAVIDNQLMLNEITPNGVILSWQDYQFSIPVVEAW